MFLYDCLLLCFFNSQSLLTFVAIFSQDMLLLRVLKLKLCPKADPANVSEFVPVRLLFLSGIGAQWSPLTLSSTFLVARGIRGRAGVEALRVFCEAESFILDWQNNDFVERFITYFERAWEDAIRDTGVVSALSHQEGRHAGLSGMHFVETLKHIHHRHNLLGDTAKRLAHFFVAPQDLSSDVLMDFYKVLVVKPICLTTNSHDVHCSGCRVLGKAVKLDTHAMKIKSPRFVTDNSYNSMDYLRWFYHIMISCMQSPDVLFTMPLWNKMIKCQSNSDVAFFDLTMEQANQIIQDNSYMNWTTLLILLCEVRQAIFTKGLAHFVWTLDKLSFRYEELAPAIANVTQSLVRSGAKGNTCYCVRLYEEVDSWLNSLGSNIPNDDDDCYHAVSNR